jgi:hypothetical protein
MITNYAVSGLALLMSASGGLPRFCAIGSGSGAEVATLGSLIAEVGSRKDYTTKDVTTVGQVTWTFDYSSVELSGLTVREFGVGVGSTAGVPNLWNREGFTGIAFDGTVELSIQVSYQTFN